MAVVKSNPSSNLVQSNFSGSNFSIWPYAIIGSFVLLAIFDAFIISAAYKTKTAPIEDSPYEAGINYESVIKAKEAASTAGLKFTFLFQANSLNFEIVGPLPSTPKTLQVKLIRPSDDTLDKKFELSSNNNIFSTPINAALTAGLWLLQASLMVDGKEYYFESKEVV